MPPLRTGLIHPRETALVAGPCGLPLAECLGWLLPTVVQARDAADGLIQRGDVDGFDEMLPEPSFTAAEDITFHAEAAQGDAAGAVAVLELPHQVIAGAVGKAEVADDHVEGLGCGA